MEAPQIQPVYLTTRALDEAYRAGVTEIIPDPEQLHGLFEAAQIREPDTLITVFRSVNTPIHTTDSLVDRPATNYWPSTRLQPNGSQSDTTLWGTYLRHAGINHP